MSVKSIDWNKASELGLIEKINRELLHPLGLALCREVETGKSPGLLIADDGCWKYPDNQVNNSPSDEQVKNIVRTLNETL